MSSGSVARVASPLAEVGIAERGVGTAADEREVDPEKEAERADGHQDQSDRRKVDRLPRVLDGIPEDRPCGDQEKGSSECHEPILLERARSETPGDGCQSDLRISPFSTDSRL